MWFNVVDSRCLPKSCSAITSSVQFGSARSIEAEATPTGFLKKLKKIRKRESLSWQRGTCEWPVTVDGDINPGRDEIGRQSLGRGARNPTEPVLHTGIS